MELHKLDKRKLGGYTTFGSVWEQGELHKPVFQLTGENGGKIPVQSQVMALWPDGSIKWTSHTSSSDLMGDSACLLPIGPEEGERGEYEANGLLCVVEKERTYEVCTGSLSLNVPKSVGGPARYLASDVSLNGRSIARKVYPVFRAEYRADNRNNSVTTDGWGMPVKQSREWVEYIGEVDQVTLQEAGPLQAVFCMHGNHIAEGRISENQRTEADDTQARIFMPFVIRMYVNAQSAEIRFTHTFFYDGEENRDFLKGMGIRFDTVLTGEAYNRHVQFSTEGTVLHETATMMVSSHPRLSPEIIKNQLAGEILNFPGDADAVNAAAALPIWNRYSICQDSAYHFSIRKQTRPECCELICRQGHRTSGVMACGGGNGGLMLGVRDFWQKYPSGLEVTNLAGNETQCTVWFYSPEAEAFDFRHYDTRSYPMTCYEGFEEIGASAYGVGVTSQCSAVFFDGIPADCEVLDFGERISKPVLYIGAPKYYHEKRAFGYWSLSSVKTEEETWLEDQLAQAFDFYQKEVDARDWYGLFDYGDVMHTYDNVRHCWKYDTGGFAWQNTELVPTYWLWLYFLRTGREDVFTMAEAMSRHCSEVDVYHFGPYKGLGSRHNVRHWGCSCKEPRIAMAGHHRFLHYLTGDLRLGDVFDDVKDGDHSMQNLPHSTERNADGTVAIGVRSGQDWSTFVSNWMTQYERTLDESYRKKIETGTSDIASTPFGFASGPDYWYDAEQAHLIYKGECENTPNQHLQICMGGPQVWLETADILEDDTLKRMLADLGAFYYLSQEEKVRLTEGKINNRDFAWPMFATGIAAYSAMRNGDHDLAAQAWNILLKEVKEKDGFMPVVYETDRNGKRRKEIPWITTNVTSQWCLNVIMCLEFIREDLLKYL